MPIRVFAYALILLLSFTVTARAGEGLFDLLFQNEQPLRADDAGDENDDELLKRKYKPGFKLRLEGFGQIRFTATENDKYLVEDEDDESYSEEFSIERVWMEAKMLEEHTLSKWELWLIYDVFAENSNLVDFWFWFKDDDMPHLQVQVGQMRIPFGWHMRTSPDELTVPDFAMVYKQLFPRFTDVGIRIGGDLIPGTKKFYYSLGVFNGDDDPRGVVTAELGWQPVLRKTKTVIDERMDFRLSYYRGRYESSGTAPSFDDVVARTRTGFSFMYYNHDYEFKGSYVSNAWSDYVEDGGDEEETSGFFVQWGYYALEKRFVPAIRFETLDVEGAQFGRLSNLALGFTYASKDYVAFQVFYTIRLEEERQPNLSSDGSPLHNDVFYAQLTVKF